MKQAFRGLIYFSAVILMATALLSLAQAQEDVYRIEYTDIFGKLRRPAIDFDHTSHTEALDEQGCGACHHAPDEESGQLVYVEDEEVSCSECHGRTPDETAPALREAFHGSCNQCHRRMGQLTQNFKGPTTCGECHIPR